MLKEWSDRVPERPRSRVKEGLAMTAFLIFAALILFAIVYPAFSATPRQRHTERPRPHRGHARAASVVAAGDSYRSCADARAAGAAPIRRGQPGYSRKLDRDNDGVACE